ncbi:MAG TPA: Hsp20/alpha crystallin family protein [Natrialbaceae archaeon]|nr:Hsp20/alpha crystallin family protein [Natrialbaceae archaeon]
MSPRRRHRGERGGASGGRDVGRSEPFPVDVVDRGNEFHVEADLPGLRKQDIEVSVRKDTLQIAVDFGDGDEGRYLRQERDRGTARRVIDLPDPVDEKQVTASYDDGVLWITLKKWHQSKGVDVE